MLIGAHESIAGGFELAPLRGLADGCEVIQIFSGPPSRWGAEPISEESATAFRKEITSTGLQCVMVHGAYLINPASPDEDLWNRSKKALEAEYRRSADLSADYLVIHPGSHRGSGLEAGILSVSHLLNAILESVDEGPVILLENTSGSGNILGSDFVELSRIREGVIQKERVGYCFDTAHAFAAGYDISGSKGMEQVLDRFDAEAGIELIMAFHLNDTNKQLGSKVDRHARIGEGILGLVPFEYLINDDRFKDHSGILETPPQSGGEDRYGPQVRTLKNLRKAGPDK